MSKSKSIKNIFTISFLVLALVITGLFVFQSEVEAEEECTDTDGGEYYYEKGTTTGLDAYGGDTSRTATYTDKCDGDRINEFVCSYQNCEGGCVSMISKECEYGCEDGACIKGIEVTSPNGGEEWQVGKSYDITWNSESDIGDVDIRLLKRTEYSSTSLTAKQISLGSTNDGKYSWEVTDDISLDEKYNEYFVKISDSDNTSVYDKSDGDFQVHRLTPPCDSYGDVNDDGYVTQDDTILAGRIVEGLEDGTSEEEKRINVNGDDEVTYDDYLAVADYVSGEKETFAVCKQEKSITVTSPNGGEEWRQGDPHTITWNSTGLDYVNIQWRTYQDWETIASHIPASDGEHTWTPEEINLDALKIRVLSSSNASIYDESDDYFSITSDQQEKSININSPTKDAEWK